MKKIIILSLGILFLFAGAGQLSAKKPPQCKYDFDKKDHITGEQIKKITFDMWGYRRISFQKTGENKYEFAFGIVVGGNLRDYVITPESTFIFKLVNGDIITLYAKDNYNPVVQSYYGSVSTVYNADYNITEEDMQKLAASQLLYIKMSIGSKNFDYEFSTKEGKEFQHKVNCIMQ